MTYLNTPRLEMNIDAPKKPVLKVLENTDDRLHLLLDGQDFGSDLKYRVGLVIEFDDKCRCTILTANAELKGKEWDERKEIRAYVYGSLKYVLGENAKGQRVIMISDDVKGGGILRSNLRFLTSKKTPEKIAEILENFLKKNIHRYPEWEYGATAMRRIEINSVLMPGNFFISLIDMAHIVSVVGEDLLANHYIFDYRVRLRGKVNEDRAFIGGAVRGDRVVSSLFVKGEIADIYNHTVIRDPRGVWKPPSRTPAIRLSDEILLQRLTMLEPEDVDAVAEKRKEELNKPISTVFVSDYWLLAEGKFRYLEKPMPRMLGVIEREGKIVGKLSLLGNGRMAYRDELRGKTYLYGPDNSSVMRAGVGLIIDGNSPHLPKIVFHGVESFLDAFENMLRSEEPWKNYEKWRNEMVSEVEM